MFQGIEFGFDRIDGAEGRGRHQAAFAGEQMELEVFEGSLGQVEEFRGEPTGFRVGLDRADELDVHAEPVRVRKRRYWSPGFGSPM